MVDKRLSTFHFEKVVFEQLLTRNQSTFTMNELYTNKLKFITCHGMNTKNLTRVT